MWNIKIYRYILALRRRRSIPGNFPSLQTANSEFEIVLLNYQNTEYGKVQLCGNYTKNWSYIYHSPEGSSLYIRNTNDQFNCQENSV